VIPALLSAVVMAACVAASARRLAFAVLPCWLDHDLLLSVLKENGVGGPARLRDIVASDGAGWERDLLVAARVDDPSARTALVNEQLRELDWRARRWERVPRVCASIATSGGFLFGCVALIQALTADAGDVGVALVSAVDALAIGIAGTSFCASVHMQARRTTQQRLAATDRLVDCLEGLLR
jgi:hypothetical protein